MTGEAEEIEEATLVYALCEETKTRELVPADFPNPARNRLDEEMCDADKILVARAAAQNGRWYTAVCILVNLKKQRPLYVKSGGPSFPRLVRQFLKRLTPA